MGARAVVVDRHLDSASRGICSLILFRQQLRAAGKMGRFNALLLLVFAFGLMISASMAKAPIAAAPKQSPTESPEAAPPASAPSQAPPATTPSQGALTPGSLSTPSNPNKHSGPAAGPGPALAPAQGAATTVRLESIMPIFAPAALVGGAAFLF